MPHRSSIVVLAVLAMIAAPAAALAAPANDDFANAIPIASGQTIGASNLGATLQSVEPNPTNGGNLPVFGPNCLPLPTSASCTSSVWFSFTPPTSGRYTLDTCDEGTDFDTVMGVYTGATLSGLTQVAADDNVAGKTCAGDIDFRGSQVTFNASAGTPYTVEVTGWEAADGFFYLRAYSGSSQPALQPDTAIEHEGSFVLTSTSLETHSGSRQTASFALRSIPAGSALECSFDGAAFTACTSPVSYDAAEGSTHTFAVRAVVNGVPDATPATEVLTIDHTPPDTSFFRAPSDPTASPTAMWALASTERNFGKTRCGLDGASAFGDCSTSQGGLCNGVHTFRAAAVDAAGNVDPTPVTQTFTETGGTAACAAPTTTHDHEDASADGPTTEEVLSFAAATHAGALYTIDYGTTTAYGLSGSTNVSSGSGGSAFLEFLQPGTTYHYRATLSTGFGAPLVIGDATFDTDPDPDPLPSISLAGVTAIGNHAALATLQIPPHSHRVAAGLRIDTSPATAGSPSIDFADEFDPSAAPTTATIPITDLEPGTYHVRPWIRDMGDGASVLGRESTFPVPAPIVPGAPQVPIPSPSPSPSPTPKPAAKFKLKASFVTITKVRHASKKLVVTVRHLPAKTTVTIKLTIGKRKLTLTRKAAKAGTLKITVMLSKTLRSALRRHTVKKLTVSIGAKPAGQSTTSVTIHPSVKSH
jgi:hypothetical protein